MAWMLINPRPALLYRAAARTGITLLSPRYSVLTVPSTAELAQSIHLERQMCNSYKTMIDKYLRISGHGIVFVYQDGFA